MLTREKKVVENLSSTTNNDLLNAAEVNAESTPASVAEMLCNKMFEGAPDVSDPYFLALVSHLACATKQAALSSHPTEALGDSLREMLLIVSCFFFPINTFKFRVF